MHSYFRQAAVVLLLSLAVGPSVPTSDPEVSPGDPGVDLGDPEVDLGDPTEVSERRLRAASWYDEDQQPKHVLPTNKQVSAFLPGHHFKRLARSSAQDGEWREGTAEGMRRLLRREKCVNIAIM